MGYLRERLRLEEPDSPATAQVPADQQTQPLVGAAAAGNAALARTFAAAGPSPEAEQGQIGEQDLIGLVSSLTGCVLRTGDSGPLVATLQSLLVGLGNSPGAIDAMFGPLTRLAVRATQEQVGAVADGVFGPQTGAFIRQWLAVIGGPVQVEPAQPTWPPKEQPPPMVPDDEAGYQTRGEERIRLLTEAGGRQVPGKSGHTAVGTVSNYPAWFLELQDILVNRTDWADLEEQSQHLLYEYAMRKASRGMDGRVAPNVEMFYRYIGRSTANRDQALAEGDLTVADLGGGNAVASNWCASAGNNALTMALQVLGLQPAIGRTQWLDKHPGVTGHWGRQSFTAVDLEPGDQVSYLSMATTAQGGHVVTVVDASGSMFTHASGNAGGGTRGSVRIGESGPRTLPPETLRDPGVLATTAQRPQDPHQVWVYIVVKWSELMTALQALALMEQMWPNADWVAGFRKATMSRYQLKPLDG